MITHKRAGWTTSSLIVLCLANVRAQEVPASGLYRITSGSYSECCGIVGRPLVDPLPDPNQCYIELAVDSQRNLAQMTFLGEDRCTVFNTSPGGPGTGFTFFFSNGVVLPDRIQFYSPIQVPENPNWNYTVSNSAGELRIDGVAIARLWGGADLPSEFQHTNIVAVLDPTGSKPTLSLPRVTANGAIEFTVKDGRRWGQTNIIEASSDLVAWTAISTNVFPVSAWPNCPFIDFKDPGNTNLPRRFYRSFSLP